MLLSNCSRETIQIRTYHLERLAGDLRGRAKDVTIGDLEAWLAPQAINWKPNTLRTYRGSFRSFFKWMVVKGHMDRSPAHELPVVRVPRARPRPAPESVYRLALMISDDRARLAILLAGACGMRRGEIARAKSEHVEEVLVGYALRVIGKGGHERMIPLTDELERELRSRPAGWLFPSPQGGHLTPAHLGKIVSRNLEGVHATHALRHRFGTVALAMNGGNLRAVQELMGHAKSETTDIYTEVAAEALRDTMRGAG